MGVTCPLNDHQVACDAVRARVLAAVPSGVVVGAGCVLQATALGSPESPIGAALRVPACVRACPFPYTAAAAPQGAVEVVRGGCRRFLTVQYLCSVVPPCVSPLVFVHAPPPTLLLLRCKVK